MSLRARLAAFIAVTVGVAVATVAFVAYGFAAGEARSEVDEFLRGRGPGVGIVGAFELEEFRGRPGRNPDNSSSIFGPLDDVVRDDAVAQFFDSSGTIVTLGVNEVLLPIEDTDLEIAGAGGDDYFRDELIDGVHYRMLTRPLFAGLAIQVGRDVTATDGLLAALRLRLSLLGAGGVAIAAAAAWFVSRRGLRPVATLTEAAEHVAATKELEARIPVERGDELGRLAGAFNGMLAALEEARTSQQRLVTDASHELRTPLTSLRTNIELLERGAVTGSEHVELVADLASEITELSHLVAEVVDLATIGRDEEPMRNVDLKTIVEQAVQRIRRRTDLEVSSQLEPTPIEGRQNSLLRAVTNLLDNASKWGGDGERIEVNLTRHRLEVRDHGPGIPADDLDHVFERFFRSTQARSMPGSGLGLSIVSAVVDDHGGEVFVDNHSGGGVVVGFTLPRPA
jgi:two-component system sensor histidine kinase MprB